VELALNLVWLVLSAGLVIACRRQKITSDHRILGVVALICLIAFLFPVISITDDLNGGALFTETNKQKRWLFGADLTALIAAAFLAFSLARQIEPSAPLSTNRPRALNTFVVHLTRRPPPAI
jgi:hypothetical protein